MRRTNIWKRRLLAPLMATLLVGCGPWDEIPGLRLGGAATEIPGNGFGFLQDGYDEILYEAWGMILPRVVTIWGVGTDEHVYVWGDPNSGWCTRTMERPDVRVRIGDAAYELRAETVTEPAEFERVAALFNAKYGEELKEMYEGQVPTAEDFGHFFRLSARP